MWGGLRILFDIAPWFTLALFFAIVAVTIIRRMRH